MLLRDCPPRLDSVRQATSATEGRRPPLPLAALELTATSAQAVTTVRLARQCQQHAQLGSFQPRLATLPLPIVEIARRDAIVSALACLRHRRNVTLVITVREVRQLQHHLVTSVTRDTTVQWVVQCRHSVLWVNISLRPGVLTALRVRQVSILTCLGVMHFLTALNVWLASMLLCLGVEQLVTALTALQGRILT